MFRRMGICLHNLLLFYEVLIVNIRKLWETRESFKKSFPRVWGCFLDRKPRGEISGAFIWCTNMKKVWQIARCDSPPPFHFRLKLTKSRPTKVEFLAQRVEA